MRPIDRSNKDMKKVRIIPRTAVVTLSINTGCCKPFIFLSLPLLN